LDSYDATIRKSLPDALEFFDSNNVRRRVWRRDRTPHTFDVGRGGNPDSGADAKSDDTAKPAVDECTFQGVNHVRCETTTRSTEERANVQLPPFYSKGGIVGVEF
jgi:hypothetical protein